MSADRIIGRVPLTDGAERDVYEDAGGRQHVRDDEGKRGDWPQGAGGVRGMRLWTLHPRYLDAKGLVTLWREALLVQKVLQGATKGYRHHPQLVRFQASATPEAAIATYLAAVLEEARGRGYQFDASKVAGPRHPERLEETEGQLLYEWEHLKQKLRRRDPERHRGCRSVTIPVPHPLFRIVAGEVREWERLG